MRVLKKPSHGILPELPSTAASKSNRVSLKSLNYAGAGAESLNNTPKF